MKEIHFKMMFSICQPFYSGLNVLNHDILQGNDESEARSLDHLLFAVLTLHLKILRECQILRKVNWAETMLPIWGKEHIGGIVQECSNSNRYKTW